MHITRLASSLVSQLRAAYLMYLPTLATRDALGLTILT